MQLQSWKRGPWLDRLLLAVLASSLLALAVLQHRWTRAASETERQRLRSTLFERLRNFEREVDRATSQAVLSFWLDPEWIATRADWRSAVLDEVGRAAPQWQTTASFPRLVRDLYLVAPSQRGDPELLSVDAGRRTLEPKPWPEELQAFRSTFVRQQQGHLDGPREAGSGPAALVAYGVLPEIPAFVLPLLRDGGSLENEPPPARGRRARLRACLLVRLDRDYIAREWLPALAARHFPDGEYDLALRSGEHAPIVYARSRRDPAEVLRAPDGGVQLLTLSMEETEPLLEEEGERRRRHPAPPAADAPGGARAAAVADPPPESAERPADFRQFVRRTIRERPDQLRWLSRLLAENGWQLRARHEAGSIEAAASRSQRQNLLLSYGILLLLAVSLGTAVSSARSARRLAQRQMEFVASVSHELRTPVAVIRALSSNLAEGVVRSEPQVALYGERLHRESGRLGDLVERTLEYAGIASSRRRFSVAPLDLSAVVRQALESCTDSLRERETRVETAFAANLPCVRGDGEALACVVRNLVENAARYSAKGARVCIGLREVGGRVELTVSDDGVGIEPADLRHLFEPFFRGRNAARDGVRGVGIGLTLARRIVIAHGGEIDVTSRVGKGSNFTVRLAAAEPA